MAVYRIPTKAVYRKTHTKNDFTWDEVYGNKKCLKCKKNMVAGDVYVVITQWKGQLKLTPTHRYQHVVCDK